jgi:hypothetical protein
VATCTILTREPGRVRVRVATPSGGILVVQQDWHAGWRATVDGAPAPCLRANAINLAVPVPPSPQAREVELRFVSRATQIGGGVSVAGVLLCAALLLACRRAGAAVAGGGGA